MKLSPELLAEMREKARANVATFPPLTGEQLADIRRIFAPDPPRAQPAPRREGRSQPTDG